MPIIKAKSYFFTKSTYINIMININKILHLAFIFSSRSLSYGDSQMMELKTRL